MVIMDMDMHPKIKILSLCVFSAMFSTLSSAAEWEFKPSINVDETYSDNVTALSQNKESSYVNQASILINSKFTSQLANFNLSSRSIYASYSHDHSLDTGYNYLNASFDLALWQNGPKLRASANVDNVSRNEARNGAADLISADTVETRDFQTGLVYDIDNSRFKINSSVDFSKQSAEDNLGEFESYSARFLTENGSNTDHVFWRVLGNTSERKNRGLEGKQHRIEAVIGFISSYQINPFLRYYDEDNSGSVTNQTDLALNSWGAGFRAIISKRLYIDSSYNFVDDDNQNEDYLSIAVNWEPSSRTSLKASYDNRFFGDSYAFDFSHRSRRLTNKISYQESVQSFDRSNYQPVLLGNFWCPNNIVINDISQCLLQNNDQIDPNNYTLVSLFDQELVEANEFSLTKNLSWLSTLKLARTTFSLSMRNNKRESLTTNIINKTFNAEFQITRNISGRSKASFTTSFQHQQFNSQSLSRAGQEDYYRRFSADYNKDLSSFLSFGLSLQHLNRSSNRETFSYTENRIAVNLTKDF